MLYRFRKYPFTIANGDSPRRHRVSTASTLSDENEGLEFKSPLPHHRYITTAVKNRNYDRQQSDDLVENDVIDPRNRKSLPFVTPAMSMNRTRQVPFNSLLITTFISCKCLKYKTCVYCDQLVIKRRQYMDRFISSSDPISSFFWFSFLIQSYIKLIQLKQFSKTAIWKYSENREDVYWWKETT